MEEDLEIIESDRWRCWDLTREGCQLDRDHTASEGGRRDHYPDLFTSFASVCLVQFTRRSCFLCFYVCAWGGAAGELSVLKARKSPPHTLGTIWEQQQAWSLNCKLPFRGQETYTTSIRPYPQHPPMHTHAHTRVCTHTTPSLLPAGQQVSVTVQLKWSSGVP